MYCCIVSIYIIQIGAKSATGLWYNYDLFNFFNVRCYGNESSILDCQYDTVGTCSSSSAIGVVCSHSECHYKVQFNLQ